MQSLTKSLTFLRFRTKLLILSGLVMVPALVATAFVAAMLHQRVQIADRAEHAVELAGQIDDLVATLQLHRGLSARVLAGETGASPVLVERQTAVERQLSVIRSTLSAANRPATDTAEVTALLAAIEREFVDLKRLQGSREQNFDRHTALIQRGLQTSEHVLLFGSWGDVNPGQLSLSLFVYRDLSQLGEMLASLRGYGSGMVSQGSYAPEELARFNGLLARAEWAVQQLQREQIGLQSNHQSESKVQLSSVEQTALADAQAAAHGFIAESRSTVLSQKATPSAAGAYFDTGTQAVNVQREAIHVIGGAIALAARQDHASEAMQRTVALTCLAVVLFLTLLLLRMLEHSTVDRLDALAGQAARIAAGDLDSPVQIAGTDELAELGHALEQMRVGLTELIATRHAFEVRQRADVARTEFLSRWSHDLRTPLNAILGFAQLLELRESSNLSDQQRENLRHIRDAGDHMLQLVTDVLDFSSIEAGGAQFDLQSTDPYALARSSAELMGYMANQRGITIQVSLSDDAAAPGAEAVLALADPTRLRQVLINLISNAIKYNRVGGRVEIDIGRAVDRKQVRISVRDTGTGFTPEQANRLFVAFNRLDAPTRGIPGTGLGLVTSKRLLEGMGGGIEAFSVPGQGSEFVVVLPAVGAGLIATAAPSPSASIKPGTRVDESPR